MISTVAATVDVCAVPGAGNAACAAAGALAGAVGSALNPAAGLATSATTSIASAAFSAFGQMVFDTWWLFQAKVLTMWTAVPTPSAADLIAPGRAGNYLAWITQYVLVVSALLAAGRTVLARDARGLADFGRTLVLTIVVSALAVTVAAGLIRAGDAIAAALLPPGLATAFGGPAIPVHAALITTGGPAGPLLLGLLGTVTSLVQYFLLLSRNAILPVVVLALPVAAAAGGSSMGKAWFGRLVAWVLALALYKPVAAVIYAVVLGQARNADTATKALTALVGMFTAVLALPALLKLFTPTPAGGGGGGSGYGTGMAVGAAARAAASRGGPR